MAVDSTVARYREQYRLEENSSNYRGWLHLAFTSGSSLLIVAFCLAMLDQVTALEWLTVPAMFLYANLAEYFGHRGPMHHPVNGLGLVYRRHTKQHHRFFTDKEMSYDSSHDFKAVLFPAYMIGFFIVAFGVPIWLVLYFAASANVAWLGLATAVAYFLNYEWLHFAYHCEPQSRVGRIPGVQALRRLHLHHHDPKLMSRYNFNITYPIGDWIFRTRYRARATP